MTNSPEISRFRERIHSLMVHKEVQAGPPNEEILLENKIFAILCENPSIQPIKCSARLEEECGIFITGNKIISILKGRRMGYPNERRMLFDTANQVADAFGKVLTGQKNAVERFQKMRKASAIGSDYKHKSQERIFAIILFQRFPEIFEPGDEEILYRLGNTLAKHFFYELCDAVNEIFTGTADSSAVSASTREKRQIAALKAELEDRDAMFSELQNEFDERLSESKIKEMTEFFAKLNSEEYGCILDQLLAIRKGADALKKSGFEIPIELNGMMMIIRKMWKFVKDSQIKPVWQPGSEITVKASDVEFSDYVGTPFASEEEEKCVRVVSPGWIFKDREIQISRPRLEEVEKA